jgi:CheY-like chemotaxis protein
MVEYRFVNIEHLFEAAAETDQEALEQVREELAAMTIDDWRMVDMDVVDVEERSEP